MKKKPHMLLLVSTLSTGLTFAQTPTLFSSAVVESAPTNTGYVPMLNTPAPVYAQPSYVQPIQATQTWVNVPLAMSATTTKQQYSLGEPVQFKLHTNKDAYVYIFNSVPGQKALIWPQTIDTHYLVRANTPITLPQMGIILGQQTAHLGYEKVLVVASNKKLDLSRGFPPTTPYAPAEATPRSVEQQSFLNEYLTVANQPPEMSQQEVTVSFIPNYPTSSSFNPASSNGNVPVATSSTVSVTPSTSTIVKTTVTDVNQATLDQLPYTHLNISMKSNAQGATYFIATSKQQYRLNEVIEINYGAVTNGTMHLAQVLDDGRLMILKSQYVAGKMIQDRLYAHPSMRQFAVWFTESDQNHIQHVSQMPANAAMVFIKVASS